MAGTALKRLMAEYKQLTLNPPEGIVAGPMNEENFFEWEALIMGPEDTCFEFGVFPAILSFPLDYPLSPPKMRFTCEMFHPNIKSYGGCFRGTTCHMNVEEQEAPGVLQDLHLEDASPRDASLGLSSKGGKPV
ncbi:ubiquitin-conjugating enzyme E2 G2 isoform X4 [Hippopotamus amphibius kiboko]|uniref:ubiquitin-conjugating enzyme E2 G2 isoform X4 n=1 Tax=Hippopotamus amphibius kiboko TaxID=575201 RepID=UPI00259A31A9|nr:ubiquitin-conjugating enzyme E2 G2 isoform X4 [Hippopotamus amphibius kiboko]